MKKIYSFFAALAIAMLDAERLDFYPSWGTERHARHDSLNSYRKNILPLQPKP